MDWISVKDENPKKAGWYCVQWPSGSVDFTFLCIRPGHKSWAMASESSGKRQFLGLGASLKYCGPLPEPPKVNT